jgi:TatD DNase family protein
LFHDAHNHLQVPALAPHLDAIADDLRAIGLARAVVNGTAEGDWPDVAALARRHAFVLPSFGLHPWFAGNRSPRWLDTLRAALDAHPRAHAGEIGLDRWMLDRARPGDPRLAGLRRAPLGEQIEVFRAQLTLAAGRNLAASIHCADAHGALLDILETTPLPARGFLLHAYSGPAEMLPRLVGLGAYFSFSGYFLAETRQRHRDTFLHVPPDRLLVETDAPALPLPKACRLRELPAPGRDARTGELNHPANIAAAYVALAGLRGVPLEVMSAAIAENFMRLFT